MGADGSGNRRVRICDWAIRHCHAAVGGFRGHPLRTAGVSVWMGAASIGGGVALVIAGLVRYRKTRTQLDAGTFEPAGFVLDLITILIVVFGLVLSGYLIYTEKSLG